MFLDNFASLNGGAIYSLNQATITGSTFVSNIARDNGGAILNGANMVITNSTITGNQADDAGGAIYHWYALSLDIYNSTIVDNTGLAGGGGIVSIGVEANATSTIIANNGGGDVSGTLNGSHNLIGGDPLLGSLSDNGGPTLTREVLDGSGAIGAGINPLNLSTDQRGAPFVRVSQGKVDIGAFQRQPPIVQVVDTVSDVDNGNYAAGNLSLREAVRRAAENPSLSNIEFSPSLEGRTITLSGTALLLHADMRIIGLGASSLTVSGNGQSRVFHVTSGANVVLNGLKITGGTGTGDGTNGGGGIWNDGANLSLERVWITGNETPYGGAGVWNYSGNMTIVDSTISGNEAQVYGGGVYNDVSDLTVLSSTVSGNRAQFGGGLYTNFGSLAVRNSTIANNTATTSGGGINGETTLISSIVAENAGGDFFGLATPASVANLISDANASGELRDGTAGNIVGRPAGILRLKDSAGSSLTGLPVHQLVATSPAINAGINSSNLPTDQRGLDRTYNGRIDIGAVEHQGQEFLDLVVDTTFDVVDDQVGLGDLSLREAITLGNESPFLTLITFDTSISGATIALQGSQLPLDGPFQIGGDTRVRVDAQGGSRVFHVGGDGDVLLRNMIIAGGRAGDGGGIQNFGLLTLREVELRSNAADFSGGAIWSTGELIITDSTIADNTAVNEAGGVWAYLGSATITGSTISGNTGGGYGAGGLRNTATMTIHNSTIAFNAASEGGGIKNDGTLKIYSTIIANNEGGDLFGDWVAEGRNNLVGDSSSSGGMTDGAAGNIVGVDPRLQPLAFNGGKSRTHALGSGSPAINAGSNTLGLAKASNNVARVRQGAPDIGAFESDLRAGTAADQFIEASMAASSG
ncbi:MAG: hypothetical protein KDA28_14645, partial [Phycisphaerales bacterium]|nr:hypothetical protein [Phycisphaerales bacterium]